MQVPGNHVRVFLDFVFNEGRFFSVCIYLQLHLSKANGGLLDRSLCLLELTNKLDYATFTKSKLLLIGAELPIECINLHFEGMDLVALRRESLLDEVEHVFVVADVSFEQSDCLVVGSDGWSK